MRLPTVILVCSVTLCLWTGCNQQGTEQVRPLQADDQSSAGQKTAKHSPAVPPLDGPNIVLISIDTLRPDHLGCYGYERPTSPTIDELAAEGVLFEDCSTTATWTLPSHASMLTGRYPSRHGVISEKYRLTSTTIADVLKRGGYLTAAYVNYLDVSDRFGLDRGFKHFRYLRESLSSPEPSGIAGAAEKWLGKPQKRPFFLFLHFYDVHSDYTSLPNYEKQFVRDYTGTMTGHTYDLLKHGLKSTLTDDDVRYLFDLYDASIRQIDDSVRQVLRALESNNLADDTVVVLTSDHGEQFSEHGSVLHGQDYYEESVRVPLILRGPGIPRGKRISTMASLVDVMPTLLELAGANVPEGIDGIDLQPVWMGRDSHTRFLFAEADMGYMQKDRKRMIRNTRYKLHFDRESEAVELYDLANDAKEQSDISADNPDLVSLLRRELATFMLGQGTTEPAEPPTAEEIERWRALGYLR